MNFQTRYQILKAYLGPFRIKQDFETIKTVAAIDALADRADMLQRGCIPGNFIPGSSYSCPPTGFQGGCPQPLQCPPR